MERVLAPEHAAEEEERLRREREAAATEAAQVSKRERQIDAREAVRHAHRGRAVIWPRLARPRPGPGRGLPWVAFGVVCTPCRARLPDSSFLLRPCGPPSRALALTRPAAPSSPPFPQPTTADAVLTTDRAAQLDHLLNQTDMYTKFLSEQMQSIEDKTDADAAAEAAAKAGAGPAAKKARKGSAGAGRAAAGSGAGGSVRGNASELTPTQVGLTGGRAWPLSGGRRGKGRGGRPRVAGAQEKRETREGRGRARAPHRTRSPLSYHRVRPSLPPPPPSIQQELLPLIKGEMRDYQLKGVKWLISLYQNGLNGILADQMGLGKTVQTIGFLSHLKSKGVHGPFLVVGPLSTLPNWVAEVERWTPSIGAVLYHGTKEERADLRAARLGPPGARVTDAFPIVVTSYEIVLADSKFLAQYKWKYVVVDEGHRLKNMNCRLLRELRAIPTANKLLLTGTR